MGVAFIERRLSLLILFIFFYNGPVAFKQLKENTNMKTA
jgi:hypothetical protein